jgi:hypothetical protein
MINLLHYVPPILFLAILSVSYYQTTTSPNENQKSKLLESLQSNILRYVIPALLLIKIYNKQQICLSTVTLILLAVLSSFTRFSKGFRLATLLTYTAYSYNCLSCPVASRMTHSFDLLLPVLLLLITAMKYQRGEKVVS